MTRNQFYIFVVACFLLFSKTVGGDTLVLKTRTLYDPANGNQPSHRMLVPKGWTLEGSAYWPNSRYFNNPPSQQYQLTSPDGFGIRMEPHLRAVEFRPNNAGQGRGLRKAEMQTDTGLLVMYRPESMEQWKKFYREKVIGSDNGPAKDFKLTSAFRLPELKAIAEKMLEGEKKSIQTRNETYAPLGVRQWLECDALAFTCKFKVNGRKMELFNVIVVTSVITKGPFGHNITWNIAPSVQFFGPEGKLASQMPLLAALANGFQEVPSWTRFKLDHLAKIDGIVRRGYEDRSRLLWQTTREIMNMRQQSFMRTSESSHRMHRRYIDSIHDVQRYYQSGYEYELPSGYKFVYGDNQGNFILTDDSLFQPNVDLNSNRYWEPVDPLR